MEVTVSQQEAHDIECRRATLMRRSWPWQPILCVEDERRAARTGERLLAGLKARGEENDPSLTHFQTALGFKEPADSLVHAQIYAYLCAPRPRDTLFAPEVRVQGMGHAHFDRFMRVRLAFFEYEAYGVDRSGGAVMKPAYETLLRRVCGSAELAREMIRLDVRLRQLECKGIMFVAVDSGVDGRLMFYHNNTEHYQRHVMGGQRLEPPVALRTGVCYTCEPSARERTEAMTWVVCRVAALETKRRVMASLRHLNNVPWDASTVAELVAVAEGLKTLHAKRARGKGRDTDVINTLLQMQKLCAVNRENVVCGNALALAFLCNHVNKHVFW